MEMKLYAASLMTDEFFKSLPSEWDLIETLLTEESVEEIDVMTPTEFVDAMTWLDEEIRKAKGVSYSEFRGLIDLIEKYEEALNYDCMSLGLRLRNVGSEEFTWGDLLTIVRHSPHSSALYRAMNPDETEWGLTEHLLAYVVDLSAVANWQRAQGKKKDYPKPIPRPGIEVDKKFGKEAISMDDMKAWLGW